MWVLTMVGQLLSVSLSQRPLTHIKIQPLTTIIKEEIITLWFSYICHYTTQLDMNTSNVFG